ncbi:MAG: hypothetical protein ACYSSI_09555 [Planctomycetota bacterium]|jgi:hypothetical protein
MSACPTVYEHPEFISSYNPINQRHQNIVKKLKDFLMSSSGDFIGEQLKHELSPFKSFPRGRNPMRCSFILCKNCNQVALDPKCGFCQTDMHSINDAVLFYIGEHDKVYKKEGRKLMIRYLREDRFAEVKKPNKKRDNPSKPNF